MKGLEPHVLENAKRICESSGSNFVRCFSLMTPSQRQAMTLFYAFCREVDDWADEDQLGEAQSRHSVLLTMKDDLSTQKKAAASRWESIVGVSYLMKKYDIPSKHFTDLVDGMLMDCQFQPFRLWNDVQQYCYRVASTVGLVSVRIFSKHHEKLTTFAIQQGLALQLINIYRDFTEDLQRGRCYMPVEWLPVSLGEFTEFLRLSENERKEHALFDALIKVRETLRFEAQRAFRLSWAQCSLRYRPAVWPLMFLGLCYRDLLDQMPVGSLECPKVEPLSVLKRSWPQLLLA